MKSPRCTPALRLAATLLTLLPLATHAAASTSVVPTPAHADARILAPQIVVAPDRADWTYAPGERVMFNLSVLSDGHPIAGATIKYRVGPEKLEVEQAPVAVPENGLRIDGGTLNQPGFIRCIAEFENSGRTYRAVATAGFSPEKIQPTQTQPADFDAFWSKHLEALAAIPVRATKTLVPEACTPEANVYHVSIQTWGPGGSPTRFYGMLAEPTQPGRYPAVLRVPGAGVRPYTGDTSLAATGLIVLDVGIHGIPVNLPAGVYEDLRNAALRSYNAYHLDNPEEYYYLRVYLGCVRSNDFLTTHEKWDGKNLVVVGGSQGGQLSIVTSALDPRVTGTVSNYPAYSDVTGYLHGRAGGWPHTLSRPENQTEAKIRTTSYYDTVNFARRLRAPISLAWGYNDETCPVTSMYAAYNVITAPKELRLQLNMGHGSINEFNAAFRERILAMTRNPAAFSTR